MPINATFHGFIETTTDSLLLFEACRRGVLPKISRRLQERERGSVKSGTVFVFDEKESGIKRWTDGLIWSPSRILGNFLIYRELGGRESLNEKNSAHDISSNYYHNHQYVSQNQQLMYEGNIQESVAENEEDMTIEERNRERNLVGSLTDTYKFRKGGLIKKTLSIQLNGCTQHLISYYTKEDVLKCRLSTPSSIAELSSLQISPELLLKQSFRVPPSVEFAELMLKRPSLSPSSTSSSSTSYSTTANHVKKLSTSSVASHPYPSLYHHKDHEEDDHLLYHSRRLTFDSPSGSRKSARTSIDSTSGSTLRSSYLEHPLDALQDPSSNAPSVKTESNELCTNSRYQEERDTQNNFRTPSNVGSNSAVTVYESSSFQNINNMSQPSLNNSAFMSAVNYDKDTNQQQRRHSNSNNSNYPSATNTMPSSVSPPPLKNFRYNSHTFSLSPPPALNYQHRLHDIPTISILSSPTYQQQGQGHNNLSSPLLSPSSFLWSSNTNNNNGSHDEKYVPQLPNVPISSPPLSNNRPETPPSILTSGYNYKQATTISHTETPVGNESSRYFDNPNKLATHNDTLYFQQPSSNIRQYNNNPIMNSQNNDNITIPKYVTNNKDTSFY